MEDLSVKERIERAMNANDRAEFVEYTMDMHAADILTQVLDIVQGAKPQFLPKPRGL